MDIRIIQLMAFLFFWTNSYGTTFVPVSIKQQVKESDAIITGNVSYINSNNHDEFGVVTVAGIELEQWVGDNLAYPILEVNIPGGKTHENEILIHGAPQFVVGERVVVVLSEIDDEYWVQNLGLGKFSVKKIGHTEMMINQIYPAHPKVGRIKFTEFVHMAERLKNQKFQQKVRDKYEIEQERLVNVSIKKERKIASVESRINQNESKIPLFWLVLILGAMSAIFHFIRNRDT